jgi:hypothetical protein
MTTNSERVDTAPSEILAKLPERTAKQLREELESLTKCLGERWIGGPWDPKDDSERCHTQANLDNTAETRVKHLAELLADLSKGMERGRIYLLLFLWQECWNLWDDYLIYRTLDVVTKAIDELQADSHHSARDASTDDWEPSACRAAGNAMRLLAVDAAIFRQIVLSDPSELSVQADRGVAASARVIEEVRSVLQRLDDAGDGGCLAARGLRYVEQVTVANQLFYGFLAAAAKALSGFHSWMGMLPQRHHSQPPGNDTSLDELSALYSEDLLRAIDAALENFRSVRGRLDSTILSRAEPWEQLLNEVRGIVLRASDGEATDRLFVPRRISIRYCYPFAVQSDADLPDNESLVNDLQRQLTAGLGIDVRDARQFDSTAFFAAPGTAAGRYGGSRVDLPDVTLSIGPGSGQAAQCKVWIVLSQMGNHCLCVEREAIESPLPQIVYRALAAGTPSVLGVTSTLVNDTGTSVAWDNLHSFSQDVIRAVANAAFWHSETDNYLRGNLHEVLIVQTGGPLATELDDIAAALNSRLGGRTLLKSIQTTASTADEWIRYPQLMQTRTDGPSGITTLPEMGLAGDWCAHTGETTVFGIAAAPSWYTQVYAEAAQFASSWSPVIRMWNRRLQEAVERASEGEENAKQAKELRQIELAVRRQLVHIKSEELCATFAYRRFLDRLLEMSGVFRLQAEMESLLESAERLMDWWGDDARRMADAQWRVSEGRRQASDQLQRESSATREKLLGVIALFGMFELGAFLELANATKWHQSFFGLFTIAQGVWEDWFIVILFATALTVGVRLGFFGNFSTLRFILSLRVRQSIRPRRYPNSLGSARIGRAARGSTDEPGPSQPQPASRQPALPGVSLSDRSISSR